MTELQDLLDRRANEIQPGQDALRTVLEEARRRQRQRRVATGAAVVALVAALATGALESGKRSPTLLADPQLVGSRQAREVRSHLGIVGRTKGAGDAVVIRTTRGEREILSVVHVVSGERTSLPADASDASVSPGGDVVATVTDHDEVVVVDPKSGARTKVGHVPNPEAPVSWDRGGSALFALVDDRWVRVSNPGRPGLEHVRALQVPKVPGGPILLSISPSGRLALLFGMDRDALGAPVPRLFLARFDGFAATDLREIDVPAGALDGPMGWVGANAFLLFPASGQALIVRTDGTSVPVRARGIPDPCRLVRSEQACVPRGPDLLGTNDDGSLLFWRITAAREPEGSGALLVLYYRTWLDGSHAVRLTGPAGRYGPPVAAR